MVKFIIFGDGTVEGISGDMLSELSRDTFKRARHGERELGCTVSSTRGLQQRNREMITGCWHSEKLAMSRLEVSSAQ